MKTNFATAAVLAWSLVSVFGAGTKVSDYKEVTSLRTNDYFMVAQPDLGTNAKISKANMPFAGVNGTNGINGINGTNGATGAQGIQGVAGINGTNGVNGTNGATGATGAQGIQGVAGIDGTNGVNGTNGSGGDLVYWWTNGASGGISNTYRIRADSFHGTGTGLEDLNASEITSGTLGWDRLPSPVAQFGTNGDQIYIQFTESDDSRLVWNGNESAWEADGVKFRSRGANGGFEGDGSLLSNLNAYALSGTLTLAQLPGSVAKVNAVGVITNAAGVVHHNASGILTNVPVAQYNASGVLTNVAIPVSYVVACSDEATAITAGTGKVTFRLPHAMTVTGVRASLSTAQASGNILTVDINEGGTSILSTKLTVDNTEETSSTAAAATVVSDTALADDAEVTIDVDQIGDSTAKGLKVILTGTR